MSYECAIVGGGMVGSALACALGEAGWRVALIEAEDPPARPPEGGFDLRVSALSPASVRILEALGVWALVPAGRVQPYRRMEIWERPGGAELRFEALDLGLAELGWIVENAALRGALEARIGALESVEWHRPARLGGLRVEPAGVVLKLGRRRLRAALVVGADGAGSPVREALGLRARSRPYGQSAVVATVLTERPHAECARQRFLATGPLAFLPLPEGHCSIVWSTTPEQAAELVALDEQAFARRLGEAFGERLGAVRCAGPRAAFPLRRLDARQYCTERAVLVGDAAHAIHPLAGQGVNLGFLDVAALAEVLEQARAAGLEPGALAPLRRYERWRKGHNRLVGEAMTAIKRLFELGGPALAPLRGLGLAMLDRCGPLKRELARAATGLGGDLPALARGAHRPG